MWRLQRILTQWYHWYLNSSKLYSRIFECIQLLAAPDFLTRFSRALSFETKNYSYKFIPDIAKDQFKRHASLHISRSRTKKTKVSAGWYSEDQLRQKFPLSLARKGGAFSNPIKISISIPQIYIDYHIYIYTNGTLFHG